MNDISIKLLKIPKTGNLPGEDSALPLQEAWVQSLVRELRACKLHSAATTTKKKRPKTSASNSQKKIYKVNKVHDIMFNIINF